MIDIIRSGDAQFDFVDPNGLSIIAASVGITRADGDGPIWWIVSYEYSNFWTPHGGYELIGEAAEEGRQMFDVTRHTSSGRTLSQIEYGKVPEGFRQMAPERGQPPALQRGVQYVLYFLGSDMAALEFEF